MRTNKVAKAMAPAFSSPKAHMEDETKQKIDLYKQVATSMIMENKFYESGRNANGDIIKSIMGIKDTEWILKLATYARNEMHLRTVPLVLATEVAIDNKRDRSFGARKYLKAIIQRPDEIPELLAYTKQRCIEMTRDKLPQMILKGLTPVWSKFNRYSIAKYRGKNRTFTLRDAMFLTHPKSYNEDQYDMYNALANNTLRIDEESGETWETIISREGNNKNAWSTAIPAMGYMALLRNINNFMKAGISASDRKYVCDKLMDAHMVHRSKQLPFRFYTAYKTINREGNVTDYRSALELALNHSCSNIPKMSGKTAIFIDTSGSMTSCTVSEKSTVHCIEIAALMGCMMNYVNSDNVVLTFDNDAHIIHPHGASVLKDTDAIVRNARGGATYLYKAIDVLTSNHIKVDRIVVLSDMRTYGGSEVNSLRKYKQTVNSSVKVFTIDLQGYRHGRGELDTSNHVYQLAGYSDRVFNLINALDEDPEAIVKHIDSINVS